MNLFLQHSHIFKTPAILKSGLFLFLIMVGININCRPDEIKKRENISDGVRYSFYQLPISLNRIHVLEIDLRFDDLRIHSVKAGNHLRTTMPLSGMITQIPDSFEVLAAINGDFFSLEGIPSGAQIQNGKIVKDAAESWMAFGVTKNGHPFIDRVKLEGLLITHDDTLTINGFNRPRQSGETVAYNSFYGNRTGANIYGDELVLAVNRFAVGEPVNATIIDIDSSSGDNLITDSTIVLSTHGLRMRSILHRLRTGQRVTLKFRSQPDHGSINELIGGYPLLVSHSENVIRHVAAQAFGFIRDKNARTAVGLSADRQKMYWVCAEDDQTNVNRGMNLEDIADFMIHIGCESALNLDGGGSATMITGKSLMNKPAEGGIERNISNAIILSRVKKNLSGIE